MKNFGKLRLPSLSRKVPTMDNAQTFSDFADAHNAYERPFPMNISEWVPVREEQIAYGMLRRAKSIADIENIQQEFATYRDGRPKTLESEFWNAIPEAIEKRKRQIEKMDARKELLKAIVRAVATTKGLGSWAQIKKKGMQ